MANLKEVRNRIASVKSTRQITSAMKMVSAAKLRRAQNAVLTMRPYALKLQEIMQNLSGSMEDSNESVFAKQREQRRVLLVVITSNRGLCGAFNANVVKETIRLLENELTPLNAQKNVDLMCLGKKGADLLKSKGYKIKESNQEIFNDLNFENATVIAEKMMDDFKKGSYDNIILIYNQFKNAAVQILKTEDFLPVKEQKSEKGASVRTIQADYIFEPNKEEILSELIPKTLKIQLYKALLDSFAAEHGARMTAMHQATENASDLLKELNLSYNKARQAAITTEILEIVSGAEALKG
ncbi:MAG: ATP synthase F1 subunit gamma [Bacteroidales bacterium]|nr:ATP synthase F1 subunit gamma [Bacteroidales bacterium]